jgi:hypothetical protein
MSAPSAGSLTLKDGGNLKLDGDFTTVDGAAITLVCDGENWYESGRNHRRMKSDDDDDESLAPATVKLALTHSLVKLRPGDSPPELPPASPLRLFVARNEFETGLVLSQ